tara:strand:- start:443 stop:793 length:351 start_codon:yes stop_codon:yes gene_type:complete
MNKFNLFLILISSIIFSLTTKVIEGACNYDFSKQSKEEKNKLCNASKIGSTGLRQNDFLKNIAKVTLLATKTQKQIEKNKKEIEQNKKNNKGLEAVIDPNKDEDTSDACKQYPEAC